MTHQLDDQKVNKVDKVKICIHTLKLKIRILITEKNQW